VFDSTGISDLVEARKGKLLRQGGTQEFARVGGAQRAVPMGSSAILRDVRGTVVLIWVLGCLKKEKPLNWIFFRGDDPANE